MKRMQYPQIWRPDMPPLVRLSDARGVQRKAGGGDGHLFTNDSQRGISHDVHKYEGPSDPEGHALSVDALDPTDNLRPVDTLTPTVKVHLVAPLQASKQFEFNVMNLTHLGRRIAVPRND